MDVSSYPTLQYQVLVVAAGLTFLAGFLINVFIVVVNICEWKKGRPVSATDKIITFLGIVRMLFQGVCLLLTIIENYLNTLNSMFVQCVWILMLTSIYSSTWLSTLLSVVYCLQIFPLHNIFFLRLKTFVLKRVLHLIMAIVVLSVISAFVDTFMPMTIYFFTMSYNSTQEINGNVAVGFWITAFIVFSFGPFLLYFISSVLLIFYLYHHISRMKSKRPGTSHLDTYYKTIKFTGFSLFCSTLYTFFGYTSTYSLYVFGFLGFYIFWQIFPTLHSMYLIYVTIRLWRQVSNMVLLLKIKCCHPKPPEETETRL